MTDVPGSEEPGRRPRYLPNRLWQLALIGAFGLFAAGVVAAALVALVLTPTLPSTDDLGDRQLKVPMRVYTAEGHLIAEFGEEKRIPVRYEDVPELLVKAILSAEDHNFFYHHGVDYLGIARAAWNNLRTGRAGQGASTITMQVARNFFLSPEKTYTRKFREVLLAFKIERELSKREILELYLNKIFLGHRAYGFAAAARIYYGKTLNELTLPEMAMLAGLPKAPSRDNPLTNPDGALERRNYVLRHMQSLGFIDEQTLQEASAAPQTASRHAFRYEVEAPYVAEMVRQYMVQTYDEKSYAGGFHVYTTISATHQRTANEALRRGLLAYDRRHGYRGPVGNVRLREEPDRGRLDDVLKDYRVIGDLVPAIVLRLEEKTAFAYTQDGYVAEIGWSGLSWARRQIDENTLGPPPKTATDVLQVGDVVYLAYIEPASTDEPGVWRLAQLPDIAGAIVALRPQDGAIVALVGGFDFYQSSFNRVIQAERQPGSSIKPFIYTAAFEKGFTPASTVSGAPIVIEDATLEDEWRPEDYSRKFYGPTRLRQALTQSLNLVSVRLLRAIGAAYAADYLERFGFDPQKLPRNLSLALGTASATPLQMAKAFAVFANGGYLIEPYFISRIEDSSHNVLEQASPLIAGEAAPTPVAAANPAPATVLANAQAQPVPAPRAAPQVISTELSFIMTTIMRDVIREGTGKAARTLARGDLAGKTGTTNEYRDAWFSGFASDLVATTWVGFDQPAPLGRGEVGGRAALPIWIDYMRAALAGVQERPLQMPEGVVKRLVNSETGKPTTEGDPEAIEEYFLAEAEPTAPETPTESMAEPGDEPVTAPPKVPEKIREQLF